MPCNSTTRSVLKFLVDLIVDAQTIYAEWINRISFCQATPVICWVAALGVSLGGFYLLIIFHDIKSQDPFLTTNQHV